MVDPVHTYRLSPSLNVLQRHWDDERVVFIVPSRETHLLNAPCAFVLGALERNPASANDLTRQMQEFVDDAQPQEVTKLVHEIIDRLSRIGMIEAVEDAS
jgi:PqqD family protein of HPr-rel-A system